MIEYTLDGKQSLTQGSPKESLFSRWSLLPPSSKPSFHDILRPFSVLRDRSAQILAVVGFATLVTTCYALPLIEMDKNNAEENSTKKKLGFDLNLVLEISNEDWQIIPGSMWPYTDLIIQQRGQAAPDNFQKVLVASSSNPLRPIPELITGKVDELNAGTNFGFGFGDEVYIFTELDQSKVGSYNGIALVKADPQGKVESKVILATYGGTVVIKFFDVRKDFSKPYRESLIYQYRNQTESKGLIFGLKVKGDGKLEFITPGGDVIEIKLDQDFSFINRQADQNYLSVASFGEKPDQVVATKIILLHPTKK